jgi:hypothetical protein
MHGQSPDAAAEDNSGGMATDMQPLKDHWQIRIGW